LNFVLGGRAGGERKVHVERLLQGLVLGRDLGIGELEEGERTAVADTEEGVHKEIFFPGKSGDSPSSIQVATSGSPMMSS